MFPEAAVSERAEGSLPTWGPGRNGGSRGRDGDLDGPGKAVPAGAVELLHLQPTFRAAGGRGKLRGPRAGVSRRPSRSRDRRPLSVLGGCRVRPGRAPRGPARADRACSEPGLAPGGMCWAPDDAGRCCHRRSVRLIPPPGLNVFSLRVNSWKSSNAKVEPDW